MATIAEPVPAPRSEPARLTGELQAIDASVVSGDVELEAALADGGRLAAETLSGQLRISLPKDTSARLRASSFSGSIKSDAGTVEKEEYGPGSSLKATLGDGKGDWYMVAYVWNADYTDAVATPLGMPNAMGTSTTCY